MTVIESQQDRTAALASAIEAGAAAFAAGRFEDAVAAFQKAAELGGGRAADLNNLGQALRNAGRLGESVDAFTWAAQADQTFADPLNHLGAISASAGRYEEARDYYRQALARRPDYGQAYFNLALAEQAEGAHDAAISAYRQAIACQRDYAAAYNNLGVLLCDLGRAEEAEDVLRDGLTACESSSELWTSLGTCLSGQGKFEPAKEAYAAVLDLDNNFQEARWNLAMLQLASGDFENGWANYRYRPSVERDKYPMPLEPWPAVMSGRLVEIHAEQGLGDELFFLRFVPALIARGAHIRYRADPKIAGLLTGQSDLRADGEATDVISLADLPYLLSSREPLPSIRLSPDPDRVARMTGQLKSAGPAPYIGVTYRAGRRIEGALFKEIGIQDFGQALSHAPGTLINLQRSPEEGDAAALGEAAGRDVADFTDLNDDLAGMLALMSLLDDCVGVSNTNMHLRAAVGQPARVLVTHPGEYRWTLAAETSPWFPDFTLYRQVPDTGWTAALQQLTGDLAGERG